jgi:hypothetical protein
MKNCLLKGLPDRCIKFSTKPPVFLKSKAQLLGVFFHTMLERVPELRKYDLSERVHLMKKEFDEQLFKFKKKYSEYSWRLCDDSFSKLPEIEETFYRISQIVFSKKKNGKGIDSDISITSEKELASKDKMLFGIVDVLIENGKEKTIVEHKTSEIFEEDYLKNQFYQQIHFYAELAFEEFGAYPNYLLVQGTEGKHFKMAPEITEAKQLGRQARVVLNRYNSKVHNNEPLENIAQVSSEVCSGCHYQAFCPEYWEKCDRIEMSDQIQSLKIKELDLFEGTSSHKSRLKVRVLHGRLSGKDIIIDRFYPKRFVNYKHNPDRELMITDLMVNYSELSGYFTDTSQIYKISGDR